LKTGGRRKAAVGSKSHPRCFPKPVRSFLLDTDEGAASTYAAPTLGTIVNDD
jgi:hypothetical protein